MFDEYIDKKVTIWESAIKEMTTVSLKKGFVSPSCWYIKNMCICVHVYVHLCTRVCAFVYTCMCICVRVYGHNVSGIEL